MKINNLINYKNTTKYFLFLCMVLAFVIPKYAEAASSSWSSGGSSLSGWVWGPVCDFSTPGNTAKCNHWDLDIRDGAIYRDQWIAAGSASLSATIGHSASVRNNTTGSQGDSPTVSVGNSITFIPAGNSGTDISWNSSGFSADTPYGSWGGGGVSCDGSSNIGSVTAGSGPNTAYYWGYAALGISPTSPTITKSGTAGLSCDGSGFTCSVTSGGTINATVTWPATSGYYSYAYTKTGQVSPPSADYLPAGTCRSGGQMRSSGEAPGYAVSVPAQNISFSLNVSASAPTVYINFSFLDSVKEFFKNISLVSKVFAKE